MVLWCNLQKKTGIVLRVKLQEMYYSYNHRKLFQLIQQIIFAPGIPANLSVCLHVCVSRVPPTTPLMMQTLWLILLSVQLTLMLLLVGFPPFYRVFYWIVIGVHIVESIRVRRVCHGGKGSECVRARGVCQSEGRLSG